MELSGLFEECPLEESRRFENNLLDSVEERRSVDRSVDIWFWLEIK